MWCIRHKRHQNVLSQDDGSSPALKIYIQHLNKHPGLSGQYPGFTCVHANTTHHMCTMWPALTLHHGNKCVVMSLTWGWAGTPFDTERNPPGCWGRSVCGGIVPLDRWIGCHPYAWGGRRPLVHLLDPRCGPWHPALGGGRKWQQSEFLVLKQSVAFCLWRNGGSAQ